MNRLLLILCVSLAGSGYTDVDLCRWETSVNDMASSTCQQDSLRLLMPFHLSYAEWKTIQCLVAADRRSFWDKEMIGLIEKSGKLRVSFRNETSYLDPVKEMQAGKGEWSNVFKNDSLEICLSAHSPTAIS